MKIDTILVPLDGSKPRRGRADASDGDRGRERQGRCCCERPRPPAADGGSDRGAGRRRCARPGVSGRASVPRDGTAGVANAETSVWYGPPVEAIVEAARYRKADLIVMSSHGRSGVGRLVFGSVAETRPCARPRSPSWSSARATLPSNRPSWADPRRRRSPMYRHKRVLVALDGSPSGEAVTETSCWTSPGRST